MPGEMPLLDKKTDSEPDYVARARALHSLISAAAPGVDTNRELAPEVVDALHEAGLFRLFVPRRLGGGEVPISTYAQVIEMIARADASTAWCLSQMNVCGISSVYLKPEMARKIFGKREAAIAWGNSNDARAVVVEGGYRISGNWDFGSGCHHATWLGAHCPVFNPDGSPQILDDGQSLHRTMLVPKSAVKISDVWDVIGLRGTGSDRYTLEDYFVPEDHSIVALLYWPDAAHLNQPVPYRLTASSLYASGFGSVGLGNARGMLDTFIELATRKTARLQRNPLAESPLVQAAVADAFIKLEAARVFMVQNLREVEQSLKPGQPPSIDQRVRIRAAGTSAIRVAAGVVNQIYDMAGTTAIFAGNELQRRFRDAHTVSQHVQGRLSHYENVGRHFLGGEVEMRFI